MGQCLCLASTIFSAIISVQCLAANKGPGLGLWDQLMGTFTIGWPQTPPCTALLPGQTHGVGLGMLSSTHSSLLVPVTMETAVTSSCATPMTNCVASPEPNDFNHSQAPEIRTQTPHRAHASRDPCREGSAPQLAAEQDPQVPSSPAQS